MDVIVCSKCGRGMPRFEVIDGEEKDWQNDIPVCQVCRGISDATGLVRKRDVLGGMPWKRDEDGKKVPR